MTQKNNTPLRSTPLNVQVADFAMPKLSTVAAAIEKSLQTNYEVVKIAVMDCPNLQECGYPARGLGGDTCLVDLGGEPYAHNFKYRDIRFYLDEVSAACGLPNAYVVGASIAHREVLRGHCGEMIPCVYIGGKNYSKAARVGNNKEPIVEPYDSYLHGGLANFFLCNGELSPVLKIEVERRIGKEKSFVHAIRQGLVKLSQQSGQLGMGGVFEMLEGKVRSHIMPDFECIGYKYYDEEKDEVFRDFLQFYETMGPNLLCFTTLWSGDPTGGKLHLRPSHEHTHFYHRKNTSEGGHYHYDITPEEVHYIGYFNLAQKVYRVNDIYAKQGE